MSRLNPVQNFIQELVIKNIIFIRVGEEFTSYQHIVIDILKIVTFLAIVIFNHLDFQKSIQEIFDVGKLAYFSSFLFSFFSFTFYFFIFSFLPSFSFFYFGPLLCSSFFFLLFSIFFHHSVLKQNFQQIFQKVLE